MWPNVSIECSMRAQASQRVCASVRLCVPHAYLSSALFDHLLTPPYWCLAVVLCSDDPSFSDAMDYGCSDWDGYDCSTYEGYSSAEMAAIQVACPRSCDRCDELGKLCVGHHTNACESVIIFPYLCRDSVSRGRASVRPCVQHPFVFLAV